MNEAIEHFKWWLQMQATGCIFAATLAKAGRLVYEPHSDTPQVDDLDTNFDLYGQRGLTAIVLLPFVITEPDFVEVLSGLRAGSQRWKLRDRGCSATGNVLVGLEWTTANGDISDAMGFAPLPSMPVPRRQPAGAGARAPHALDPAHGRDGHHPPGPELDDGPVGAAGLPLNMCRCTISRRRTP